MKHHFSAEVNEYRSTYHTILDEMIRGMTRAHLTDSISQNFIRQMIPHHRAAIEMSQNILRCTDNPELTKIAEQIVAEQTRSIENMRQIECTCAGLRNSRRELCAYQSRMNRIMRTMFTQMHTARATGRVNCDFIREMIPHHMGAIRMSSLTLKQRICPELIPILQAIITSQECGVCQMQALARSLRCER